MTVFLLVVVFTAGVAVGGGVMYKAWRDHEKATAVTLTALTYKRISGGWIELRLSDGRIVRSERGIIWFSFPDGTRLQSASNSWLEAEYQRLTNRDRWGLGGASS